MLVNSGMVSTHQIAMATSKQKQDTQSQDKSSKDKTSDNSDGSSDSSSDNSKNLQQPVEGESQTQQPPPPETSCPSGQQFDSVKNECIPNNTDIAGNTDVANNAGVSDNRNVADNTEPPIKDLCPSGQQFDSSTNMCVVDDTQSTSPPPSALAIEPELLEGTQQQSVPAKVCSSDQYYDAKTDSCTRTTIDNFVPASTDKSTQTSSEDDIHDVTGVPIDNSKRLDLNPLGKPLPSSEEKVSTTPPTLARQGTESQQPTTLARSTTPVICPVNTHFDAKLPEHHQCVLDNTQPSTLTQTMVKPMGPSVASQESAITAAQAANKANTLGASAESSQVSANPVICPVNTHFDSSLPEHHQCVPNTPIAAKQTAAMTMNPNLCNPAAPPDNQPIMGCGSGQVTRDPLTGCYFAQGISPYDINPYRYTQSCKEPTPHVNAVSAKHPSCHEGQVWNQYARGGEGGCVSKGTPTFPGCPNPENEFDWSDQGCKRPWEVKKRCNDGDHWDPTIPGPDKCTPKDVPVVCPPGSTYDENVGSGDCIKTGTIVTGGGIGGGNCPSDVVTQEKASKLHCFVGSVTCPEGFTEAQAKEEREKPDGLHCFIPDTSAAPGGAATAGAASAAAAAAAAGEALKGVCAAPAAGAAASPSASGDAAASPSSSSSPSSGGTSGTSSSSGGTNHDDCSKGGGTGKNQDNSTGQSNFHITNSTSTQGHSSTGTNTGKGGTNNGKVPGNQHTTGSTHHSSASSSPATHKAAQKPSPSVPPQGAVQCSTTNATTKMIKNDNLTFSYNGFMPIVKVGPLHIVCGQVLIGGPPTLASKVNSLKVVAAQIDQTSKQSPLHAAMMNLTKILDPKTGKTYYLAGLRPTINGLNPFTQKPDAVSFITELLLLNTNAHTNTGKSTYNTNNFRDGTFMLSKVGFR